MKRTLLTFTTASFLLLSSSLTSLPAFAATEPAKECNLQKSLEVLMEIRDPKEESSAYGTLLREILSCSFLEVQNLKARLTSIKDLEERDIEIRDNFLEELDEFELYYKTLEEQLTSKEKDAVELKQIAAELLLWRKEYYNKSAKEIASFIFIFQGKDAIQVANTRVRKISLALLDAGLLFRRDTWKDFRVLLNEAQQHIDKASKLNTEAYNLFAHELEATQTTSTPTLAPLPEESEKSTPTVTDLLRESLTEIREAYRAFGEISKIVQKILG